MKTQGPIIGRPNFIVFTVLKGLRAQGHRIPFIVISVKTIYEREAHCARYREASHYSDYCMTVKQTGPYYSNVFNSSN